MLSRYLLIYNSGGWSYEDDSCGIPCNQHEMSFLLICDLLDFEKSIEVFKFDKTSVNSQRFFLDLGETLMYNEKL